MRAADLLAAAKIERGEAELLLASAIKKTHEAVLAHPEARVSAPAAARFRAFVARRRRHEPVAYLLGEKWFYGRAFTVTKDTLIPRPETETLIQAVLDSRFRGNGEVSILDIGTGSGAIGLTLAAELPQARAALVDVSPASLAVARKNAKRLGLLGRVSFKKIDVLEQGAFASLRMTGPLIIAANLPYLPTAVYRKTMPDVRRFEPRLALVSGKDGLDHYRALLSRLAESRMTPDLLLLEADPPQFRSLAALVRLALPGHGVKVMKDLGGRPRILTAKRPG